MATGIQPEQYVRDIASAVGSSDLLRAHAIATEALDRGLSHPTFFNARALWLEEQQRFQEALLEFGQARALAPLDPDLLNAIGLCQLRLQQFQDAVESFEAALAVRPAHALTCFRLAWANEMVGAYDAAERAYERAIALQPNFPEALASLAGILATKGETSRARSTAERALSIAPGLPSANLALAITDLSDAAYSAAESRLRDAIGRLNSAANSRSWARAQGLLGDALDGQGRFAEAFAAYVAENEALRALYAGQFSQRERPADGARRLISWFEDASREDWLGEPSGFATPAAEHVFVVGFMRSGTTLLGQVLAGHPDVVVLEERDPLQTPAEQFLGSEAGFDSLVRLADSELDVLREEYWERVPEFGLEVNGKVVVDKHPLNTLKLPLIAKLFPEAKILFAMRDPRDVVLSCFHRHFALNPATFAFLRLTEAAEFYDQVMRLAALFRQTLPLTVHEVRYEDVAEQLEATIKALCPFIGIEWSERMSDFSATASSLSIHSPSAPQLRRGLSRESIGRWRNYEEQLAPILPVLQPWVDCFGYAAR
jgi:tetratricopeptide (TPR) repeat protein